jgi:putative endonuclease
MPFHTYILRSESTGQFYIGHTENLTKRIFERNNNRTTSIKNRGPWKLFYSEVFDTRSSAARREREIKNMKSRIYIESLAERPDRIGKVGGSSPPRPTNQFNDLAIALESSAGSWCAFCTPAHDQLLLLLSCPIMRSTENAPAPRMTTASPIAIASKWYSKPSPF